MEPVTASCPIPEVKKKNKKNPPEHFRRHASQMVKGFFLWKTCFLFVVTFFFFKACIKPADSKNMLSGYSIPKGPAFTSLFIGKLQLDSDVCFEQRRLFPLMQFPGPQPPPDCTHLHSDVCRCKSACDENWGFYGALCCTVSPWLKWFYIFPFAGCVSLNHLEVIPPRVAYRHHCCSSLSESQ